MRDAALTGRRWRGETGASGCAYRPLPGVFVLCAFIAPLLILAGCSSPTVNPRLNAAATANPAGVEPVEEDPPAASEEKVEEQPARGPYEVAAKAQSPEGYSAEGLASWYGLQFHGRSTANGEVFDKELISAAHPSLPLPSYARVTNVSNGKSIVVRVNDRGPFHGDRALDVSERVADILDFKKKGMAQVRIDYVGPASLSGSDEGRLLATYRENGSLPTTALASLEPSASASPATTPETVTGKDRVGAAFSGFATPQPLTSQGVMVQPVLSGFAFSPSAYNGQR